MSDETQLQVTAKDGDSSLTLSKGRSGLIARGRRDAEILALRDADLLAMREALVARFRQSADKGDANFQWELGRCYYEGDGVPKDYAEALVWYRKAADQLHLYANTDLGDMYERGVGVPAGRAEAVRYYFRAADIAIAYMKKSGALLRDSSVLDDWDPDWVMGAVGDGAAHGHAEAASYWRVFADQGDATAQCWHGYIYEEGDGVPQDHAEAVRWYRKAADQGHADAQFRLGLAYGSGTGVAGDLTEATKWYRQAADQGHAEAQFNLAFYYLGSDEPQDHTEAVCLFRMAADQGNAEAQYWLGTSYEQGEGIPQDYVMAHLWFDLSASNSGGGDQERRAKARDEIARKMTPGQIAEAQRLAREWKREKA